ncbi:hypothetical protein DCAR_0415008 [Daucus carota subsp. sativus]|uniref:DC1 domain-containing protein n=1 Tax=Daucus carota subsp. sativus TaxID=79200 RepID=A0A162A892_DAUCS|nr:PREDICTED: uncharacterized protein LOC108217730 [Daucus carota subsp. sativus]WOG95681.1 hypothetical protein DCAR_0415008 [Daucus carota subsp. sativus]
MEFKHFSHNHSLIVHQVIQGTEVTCSGCNSPATGAVYVCWPCNFFLHEFCFSASRSMTHASHPPHPLTLVPYPTYPSNTFYCNSCNLVGTGLSYSCSHCDFDLHVHCAYMPTSANHTPQTCDVPDITLQNQTHHPQQVHLAPPVEARDDATVDHNTKNEAMPNPSGEVQVLQSDDPVGVENAGASRVIKPRGLKHFSHSHPLYPSEFEDEDPLFCSACEEEIIGTAYRCSKSKCDYHLHKKCFELPREIRHKSHVEHPLTLLASPVNKETEKFTCNACFGVGSGFTYNCSTCDYDLHVSCSSLPETVKSDHHDHELSLMYSSPVTENEKAEQPGITFSCKVCENVVPESYWLYYCADCKYGIHLGCLNEKDKYEGKSLEEVVVDHQAQMQRLQIQMDMARQNAQFLISMGQSLASL